MGSSLKLPAEGSCRCGQIRFQITAPPILTMACHCKGCQKMTSSAYSISAAVPTAGFQVTQGEPVIGGLHGDDIHHYFCPHCMSWMFTRVQGLDFFVNVRPSMLDDGEWAAWFAVYVETWTSEKLPFAATAAKISYPGFPKRDEFETLMQGYAAQA